MSTNKISNTNQILLVTNIIALLFFIFSDKIITSIKWSNEGIGIGDIATVLSAMIMGFTAWVMYKGNKIAEKSVKATQLTVEAQLIMDLRKEYDKEYDKGFSEGDSEEDRQGILDILDRMSLFYNSKSISKEFAQNTFLFYLINDVTTEINSDFEWNCYKELLTTYKEWIPDYKHKHGSTIEFEDPNIKYRTTTTHEVSLDDCMEKVTTILNKIK